MWLALSLSFEKWYQSILVTPSGVGALYVVDFEEGIRDLSGKDCDTLESLSHIGWVDCEDITK